MQEQWNPWHGCHKLSAGCLNCYVYRMDGRHGGDASTVRKNAAFYDPIRHARDGGYRFRPGSYVWTCFTSDFLVEDADVWREEAWRMMRLRSDCTFFFITKRIDRFEECKPKDWGTGYPNVQICCTVENQDRADYRLPIFRDAPILHKSLACEPLLGPLNLMPYLGDWVRQLVAGGESGEAARVCKYEWILSLREQCTAAHVPFYFKQTGANFEKDGKIYRIPRKLQHAQARKAGINTSPSLVGRPDDWEE